MAGSRDWAAFVAAATVAVAAASGGAFAPTPRLLAGLAFAALAAWLAMARPGPLARHEWLGLGVVAWGAVSAVAHRGNPLAAKELLATWLVAWLVWVAARRADDEAWRAARLVVSCAAAVVAAAVVLECLGAGRLRMGGMYANPNVAAALLVPAATVAWGILGRDRRGWCAPVVVLLVAGVIATGSRAGLLALVVAVWLAFPSGRARTVGGLAAAAGTAALLAWRFAAHPDSLAWHRLEIWRALWQLVEAHPVLGVGPGWLEDATGVVRIAHEGAIARYRHIIGSAESSPLGLLVRTGWVGLGVAMWSAAAWLRLALKGGLGRDRAARACVAAVAVLAAFHDVLDQGVVLWWWALLVGMAVRAPAASSAARDTFPVPVAARAGVALATAGLVLWGMVQPAHARWLWWSRPSSSGLARQTLRAEPWFAEAARWRTRDLLRRQEWSWEEAAEAMAWSRRSTGLHSASAGAWSESGLVNARIVEQLGTWPDVVAGAREGFRRATTLEPHLPWHWLRWAQLERTLGRLAEASELAARSVEEEPEFVRGWLFLARVEMDLGDGTAARNALERAREASQRARWRLLSEYERDLVELPGWQAAQLQRELGAGGG